MKTAERLVSLERRLCKIESLFDGRLDNFIDTVGASIIHILELEDAWRSGALESRDGLNDYRSNRNFLTRAALEHAMRALASPPEKKQ